jgi:hypothetical protein
MDLFYITNPRNQWWKRILELVRERNLSCSEMSFCNWRPAERE